jgi:hypothetical protein
MLEQYFDKTADGFVLRGEQHDRFFADLHETVQRYLFEGETLIYKTLDGSGTAEVRLPEPEELIAHTQMRVAKDGVHIGINFPATVFPDGEDGVWYNQFVYIPPATDETDY